MYLRALQAPYLKRDKCFPISLHKFVLQYVFNLFSQPMQTQRTLTVTCSVVHKHAKEAHSLNTHIFFSKW